MHKCPQVQLFQTGRFDFLKKILPIVILNCLCVIENSVRTRKKQY